MTSVGYTPLPWGPFSHPCTKCRSGSARAPRPIRRPRSRAKRAKTPGRSPRQLSESHAQIPARGTASPEHTWSARVSHPHARAARPAPAHGCGSSPTTGATVVPRGCCSCVHLVCRCLICRTECSLHRRLRHTVLGVWHVRRRRVQLLRWRRRAALRGSHMRWRLLVPRLVRPRCSMVMCVYQRYHTQRYRFLRFQVPKIPAKIREIGGEATRVARKHQPGLFIPERVATAIQ